ncbi:hypothetical protein [Microbacterium capsulatum]|uniref:Uncharacterized protein n=1 Tax=Microbacterium capsulatum TaxID=3041921 RepID=A0ABU0XD18_9MICO|nr:hypothetical protein [Microbacterium sp. ASV81]MDQ4213008.1 hypothetical protein [Microbacterium sp. ASV81]
MTRRNQLLVSGSVPVPLLRLVSAAVIIGAALALNPSPVWRSLAVAAALVSVIVPRSLIAWAGIACLPLGIVLTPASAGRTVLAILVIHVAHVLAAWAWAAPWRSRIRFALMLPSLRRLLLIQVAAQAVAAVMTLLVPPLGGPGLDWLAPLGAVLLLGAAALVLRVSPAP